jgi:hypothetical protein
MSIEFETLTVVLLAVPLLVAVWGLFLATRSTNRMGLRLIGLGLAILGLAEIVAVLIWFSQGCFETWQPCGKAPGLAVWFLWVGLALALVVAAVSCLYSLLSDRRRGGAE